MLSGQGLPVLDWVQRQKIALGAAKGLAYLHEDCTNHLLHLLDSCTFALESEKDKKSLY